MEQRRLRLGDIVDDYCPRERRVTNHAVVAMIEEDIRQTRCTTCDAEHVYKGGSAPRRRRKELEEIAASPTGGDADRNSEDTPPADGAAPASASAEAPVVDLPKEDGPVRRPLIRATLPRTEGQPAARPAPEFTIRQPGLRGGYDRGARGGMRGPGGNGQQRFSPRPAKGGGRPGGGPGGRFDRGGRRSDKKRSR